MSATFNPGDIVTISTTSYKGRKFTVVESSDHRTILCGARGARRVLVASTFVPVAGNAFDENWHIYEDDGERNRGRACIVEHSPAGGPFARVDAPPALTVEQVNAIERAGLASMREAHRPIEHRELALLMKCETPRELAEWVLGRAASHASVTKDQHAADTAAAMRLLLSALDIQRTSKEAAGA
jgi:hypothetical protein